MSSVDGTIPADVLRYGFELKWRGERALCFWNGEDLRFQTGSGADVTEHCPEFQSMRAQLGKKRLILDGEIVAFDARGRQDPYLLARRLDAAPRKSAAPLSYMIFDVLYWGSESLLTVPYKARRRVLDSLNLRGRQWSTPTCYPDDPQTLLSLSRRNGFDGIVAKRWDGLYRPGARSADWIRIKNQRRPE